MKTHPIAYLTLLGLLLVEPAHAQRVVAQFNPGEGIVPNPINLLFSGSTDGTLNIPNSNNNPVIAALNALDGFSTVAPFTTTFSGAVDPATLVAGTTVRLFEVALVNPFLEPATDAPFAVTEAVAELQGNIDFSAGLLPEDPAQRTVLITPLKPLQSKTGYMVVITDGVRAAAGGAPVLPDQTYIFARYQKGPLIDDQGRSRFRRLTDQQAQALEPLRRVVVSQEEAAASAGVSKGHIVVSWSFITQSTNDVLATLRAELAPAGLALRPTGLTTAALGLDLPGLADIYAGTLTVVYYLEAPTLVPTVILSTHWQGVNDSDLTRYNPRPSATQTLTIPLLATLPNTRDQPATGWPAVIFQHGITRNRTDVFAVADGLASVGLAAVAIDLPLHGITDRANPFFGDVRERTFNVDLVDNDTGAPGADGRIDPSGQHFINLTSLLTSRDNLRQGIADLMQLSASLAGADSDADSAADFDANQVQFWGNSLGGIAGVPFLALDDDAVNAATLTVTGGGIANLLAGSATFGPRIAAGLAALGLAPGTPGFAAFLRAGQQALDAADPINYAAAAANAHPIYLAEVLGDEVLPNSVAGAPLAGTEALARIMGLPAVAETQRNDAGVRALVRFSEGTHGSPLSPAAGSPAATLELQTEAGAFLASQGTLLPVSNPAVVQPAP